MRQDNPEGIPLGRDKQDFNYIKKLRALRTSFVNFVLKTNFNEKQR